MATTSRLGSAMLSARISLASPRTTTLPSRAFSTALALRQPSGKRSDDSQGPAEKPRMNPLLGNNAFNQPKRERSAPTQDASGPAAATSPPPPPPPPAASSDPSTTSAEATPGSGANSSSGTDAASGADHPYTAANASAPLNLDIASIIANKSASYGRAMGVGDPTAQPNIRVAPVVGRTIFIRDRPAPNSAGSAGVALRLLDSLTRKQHVKNKYHSQKFHERPGLRKKRLRMSRWRSRFKEGFKAAATRVLQLKKQGW